MTNSQNLWIKKRYYLLYKSDYLHVELIQRAMVNHQVKSLQILMGIIWETGDKQTDRHTKIFTISPTTGDAYHNL